MSAEAIPFDGRHLEDLDREGTFEKIGEYLKEHPVQTALGSAMVLTASLAGLHQAGALENIPGIGQYLEKAGAWISETAQAGWETLSEKSQEAMQSMQAYWTDSVQPNLPAWMGGPEAAELAPRGGEAAITGGEGAADGALQTAPEVIPDASIAPSPSDLQPTDAVAPTPSVDANAVPSGSLSDVAIAGGDTPTILPEAPVAEMPTPDPVPVEPIGDAPVVDTPSPAEQVVPSSDAPPATIDTEINDTTTLPPVGEDNGWRL